MTYPGENPASSGPGPAGDRGPWTSEDLRQEAQASALIERFLAGGAEDALEALAELMAPRLDRVEPAILDEIGAPVDSRAPGLALSARDFCTSLETESP